VQSIRVAGAVGALVVVANDGQNRLERRHRATQFFTQHASAPE
jgi:hypothetical protein